MYRLISTAVGRAATAASSIILTLALASRVDPDVLGRFFIAQSAVMFITQLTRAGMDRTIILRNARRKVLRHPVNVFELVIFCVLTGGIGVGAVIILYLSKTVLSYMYDNDVVVMMMYLGPAIPGLTVLLVFSAWLKSEQRPELGVFFEIGGVNVAMLVILLLTDISPQAAFVGAVVMLLLVAAAIVWRRVACMSKRRDILRYVGKALCRAPVERSLGVLNIAVFLGLNVSMLVGGMVLQTDQLAALRLAERLALAVSFPLLVQSSIVPTRFAREVRLAGRFSLHDYAPHAALCAFFSIMAGASIWVAHASGWSGLNDPSYAHWFDLWIVIASAHMCCAILGPTESVAAAVGYGGIICTAACAWLAMYVAIIILFSGRWEAYAVVYGFAMYIVGLRLSAFIVISRFLSLKPRVL